ncbi:hypothetical protein EC991_009690 [Linnemannia zychae]|nr:hypothetical protein EC991_009690 [Linnemannia zychae]
MASSYEKVFECLDLTYLIADNLTKRNLAYCCLVSHQWNDIFIPHLWHSITIQDNDRIRKFTTPEGRSGLLRNGRHIRVLRATTPSLLQPFVESGTTCTNLVSLDTMHASINRFWSSEFPRSSAMLSKGRRGSIGNIQDLTSAGLLGQTSMSFAFGTGSNPAPSEFGIANNTPIGFGNPFTIPRLNYADDGPAGFAGTTVAFGTPMQFGDASELRDHGGSSVTPMNKDAESYLIAILERNSHLEFLVVPSHYLESEAVIKVAGERLLSLKEFYSPSDIWASDPSAEYTLFDKPEEQGGKAVVSGCIRAVKGDGHDESSPMKAYPRLKELRSDIAEQINRNELRSIKSAGESLTHLVIQGGFSTPISQILMAAPLLKSIVLSTEDAENWPMGNTAKDAFLKHAPTLEVLDVSGFDFDKETLQAILSSCKNLKVVKTMLEVDDDDVPKNEVSLDGAGAIVAPWVCTDLEEFECKITGIPRLDTNIPFADDGYVLVHVPLPQQTPHVALSEANLAAQQASRTLQRGILRQLGRLTKLRKLALGRSGRNYEQEAWYSHLEIKEICAMVVDDYFQIECLELSLEGGLEELAGLKDLEELDLTQMAHRIGVAEVQWMVEHWPKLKMIRGLTYSHRNADARSKTWGMGDGDSEDEEDEEDESSEGESESNVNTGPVEQEVEPEHITWMRENRPDILIFN